MMMLYDDYNDDDNEFHRDRAWILDVPVNIEKMREATKFLLGKHDFAIFRNSGCQSATSVKEISELSIRYREASPVEGIYADLVSRINPN